MRENDHERECSGRYSHACDLICFAQSISLISFCGDLKAVPRLKV